MKKLPIVLSKTSRQITKRNVFLIIFIFIHCFIVAQETLYFIQGSTLYKYTLPSGPEISLDVGNFNLNTGLTFDQTHQMIYWKSNLVAKSLPADFDASSTPTEFNIKTASGFAALSGIAIDEVDNNLYTWENDFTNLSIIRYDLDNADPSSTRTVVHSFPSTGKDISAVSIDNANNRIYYSISNEYIRHVTLDGNNQTDLITFTGSDNTFLFKKDPYNDRVLFGNGDNSNVVTLQSIPTIGGAVTTLISESGNDEFTLRPFDVFANGDIYFGISSAFNPSQLRSGNLTGTSPISTSNFAGTSFNASAPFVSLAVGFIGSSVPTIDVQVLNASSTTIEDSGTPLKYTFTLSAAAATTTTVNFEISGGTAGSGDFAVQTGGTFNVTFGNTVANQGTIDIPTGGTTAELEIIPNADAIIENDETVAVKILAP